MLRHMRCLMSTVNKQQMELFKSINGWWKPDGPMHILYAYNYERIKFMRKFMSTSDQIQPFSGLKVLDVGCGAGFLSQSITRLGAHVTGLDPNETSFTQASSHQLHKPDLANLTYHNLSLEDFQQKNPQLNGSFDIITSMEVIEHVDNPLKFVSDIEKSVKGGGLVMLSTIRRSFSTWFTHILVAQKIIGMVPSGTHHHEKFINPDECEHFLKSNGLEPLATLELDLNWKGQFVESSGGGNYLIMARKPISSQQSKNQS